MLCKLILEDILLYLSTHCCVRGLNLETYKYMYLKSQYKIIIKCTYLKSYMYTCILFTLYP